MDLKELLKKIKLDFEVVQQMKEPGRTIALSKLMTTLENRFDIPLLKKDLTEEQKESEYYKLYLQIARERIF